MDAAHGILLTGATGLIGRFVLRDLLDAGHEVGVLIRNGAERSAEQRLNELLDFACQSRGRKLPRPTLLVGDLRQPGLGLDAAGRDWLDRKARSVIHSAAYVAYQPTPDGEPWETNVNGLYRLLELCRAHGIAEFHHVSTAFVNGDRRGVAFEDELDIGEGSGNAYEQSKFAAEQMIRDFTDIKTTIYRPSIVVGDTATGYTNTYHHFYRFLELGVRLAARPTDKGRPKKRRDLSLRLPLSGAEKQNFVPVDWVSRALVEIVRQPHLHGRTYHLVARQAIRLAELTHLLEDVLHLEGIHWVGDGNVVDPTAVERMVWEQFEEYWSYLRADVDFDCRNTWEALPDLPPPPFDGALIARLLRFAEADNWGRQRARTDNRRAADLAHQLENVLPARMRQSQLAEALPSGSLFALAVHGDHGGQWLCRCGEGALRVRRAEPTDAEWTYRMDAATLEDLLHNRQTAQQAFFDGQIQIEGDTEKALKLALLLEQFLAERATATTREEQHAAAER